MVLIFSLALGSVADRVIAVVDAQVVLATDVRIGDEIRYHNPSAIPFWSRPDASVEAAVVRAAAGDLTLYQPTPARVTDAARALEEDFGSENWRGFVARWNLGPAEVRSLVRRRLVVEAWLLRNLTAPPTSPEAQAQTDTLIAELERRLRVRRVPPLELP